MAGGGVGILVLALAAYFLVKKFTAPPPPPPVVAKQKPPAAKPPVAVAAVPAAPLTPSETLNAVAHAPIDSINRVKEAVVAHRASEQARVDAAAIGEEPPDKKPVAPSKPVETSSPIAPGISATNSNVESAGEATPAFRSFIANAKISGVFQGAAPRVMINGRLARAGDTVESSLGVVFDHIDADKKLLVFKDKSGATVTRRY